MNKLLLSNIRFYFAQSVFMSNCHYKAVGRLQKRKTRISNIVLGFSATTILLLVMQVIGLQGDLQGVLNVAAFVGLILTGSSLVLALFNREDLSMSICNHKSVAEKYKNLRDDFMALIEEVMSSSSDEAILRNKKDLLQKRYSQIGETSPETTYRDYSATQKGLGLVGLNDEEFTWSNAEINKFLPEELRLQG